jgi:spectinomycin phosphotransferase
MEETRAVLTEPRDLDRSELEQVLEDRWGLRDPRLDYLAVGFGSHHWRAVDSRGTRSFVTVDDLEADFRTTPDIDSAFAALDRAFRTAALLRDNATLEFVLAPLFDRDGVVIHRLNNRYAVTVSPLIDGESSEYGPYEEPDDRRAMGAVLGRLHAATDQVPADLPRREDFALPSRAELVEALHDLDRTWDSGPFAEQTRKLLQLGAHDLEMRLHEYDELVAGVRASSDSWVITHGEPHRANVIRDPRGGVYLVDWDTTLIAPRERDLQMVLDQGLTGWDEYSELAGVDSLNHEALHLYRLWWELADITVVVAGFRGPHERTEDMVASWEILARNLAR